MSLRIFSLYFALIMLGGCGLQSSAPQGDLIECAIGPGAQFSKVCTLETLGGDDFVIHHPDGGFRRFVWTGTGGERAIGSVIGAGEVEIRMPVSPSHIEFALDNDRYRYPVGEAHAAYE